MTTSASRKTAWPIEQADDDRERDRRRASLAAWRWQRRSHRGAVDRSGRIEARHDCTVPGHPEIFAVGT